MFDLSGGGTPLRFSEDGLINTQMHKRGTISKIPVSSGKPTQLTISGFITNRLLKLFDH